MSATTTTTAATASTEKVSVQEYWTKQAENAEKRGLDANAETYRRRAAHAVGTTPPPKKVHKRKTQAKAEASTSDQPAEKKRRAMDKAELSTYLEELARFHGYHCKVQVTKKVEAAPKPQKKQEASASASSSSSAAAVALPTEPRVWTEEAVRERALDIARRALLPSVVKAVAARVRHGASPVLDLCDEPCKCHLCYRENFNEVLYCCGRVFSRGAHATTDDKEGGMLECVGKEFHPGTKLWQDIRRCDVAWKTDAGEMCYSPHERTCWFLALQKDADGKEQVLEHITGSDLAKMNFLKAASFNGSRCEVCGKMVHVGRHNHENNYHTLAADDEAAEAEAADAPEVDAAEATDAAAAAPDG